MNSLSYDLRAVIETHVRKASPQQVLAIAAALYDQAPDDSGAGAAPSTAANSRFTVQGDMVYDAQTNLTWTRKLVSAETSNHADAMKAAAAVRLGGFTDWRAPTIQERLSIVDYERSEPAIDTSVFESPSSGWEWTSTPYKPSPGDAWLVGFNNGHSGAAHRDGYDGFVRAVRPGQFLVTLG